MSDPLTLPLQSFHVGPVLVAPSSELVLHQVMQAEDRNANTLENPLRSLGPGRLEIQPRDPCKDVDPVRWQAKLYDNIGAQQVVESDTQVLEWRTERGEGLPNAPRIVVAHLDPDVDVDGRSRVSMDGQGVSADDEKPSILRQESVEKIPVVLVHRQSCYWSASVVSLTGIVCRVYVGNG